MKTFQLNGELRSEHGKKATKSVRKGELVPCNLYGLGENVLFTVLEKDAQKLIYSPGIIHLDFLEVNEKKPVTVEIPVKLQGHAEGVKLGGKLSLEKRKLKVKGVYTAIPERIEIDVTELGIGKKITVGDIQIKGLELMNPKDVCVAQVKATRASASAAAAPTE